MNKLKILAFKSLTISINNFGNGFLLNMDKTFLFISLQNFIVVHTIFFQRILLTKQYFIGSFNNPKVNLVTIQR